MKNDVYLQHFDLFYIENNIHRSVEGELFINLKLSIHKVSIYILPV